ncbi:MAG: hypothetical protein ABIQ95_09380 [Bdellovibrionia bacterium]
MKNIILAATVLFSASAAMAQNNFCDQYASKGTYLTAIATVASKMNYTFEELCSLPRLMDIQMLDSLRYSEDYELIDHSKITLHYETYSCDYFVRNSDQVVTKKGCYNTW